MCQISEVNRSQSHFEGKSKIANGKRGTLGLQGQLQFPKGSRTSRKKNVLQSWIAKRMIILNANFQITGEDSV